MLRTKLRQLLDQHSISPYKFAQAVKQTGTRSESWAYKTARGEIGLTSEGIETVIRVLRELTGADINVSDVVEYCDEGEFTSNLALTDASQRENKILSIFLAEPDLGGGEIIVPYSAPERTTYTAYAAKRRFPRFSLLFSILSLVAVSFIVGRYSQPLAQVQSQVLITEKLDEPLSTPIPIGPEGEIQSIEPKLRIEAVTGATHYTYSIFNTLSRQNVLYENSKEPFFIVPKNALCPNAPYSWKARAHRGEQESSFSSNTAFFRPN